MLDRYAGPNPYRVSLRKALKRFGLDQLKPGEEFWTLGGPRWHEYDELTRKGMILPKHSYHNVDRGPIETHRQRCIAHPFTEFEDIHNLWTRPKILSLDSTMGALKSNRSTWVNMYGLAIAAAKLTGSVSFNVNLMVDYSGADWVRQAPDPDQAIFEEVGHWANRLAADVLTRGMSIEFYGQKGNLAYAEVTKRKTSQTRMVHFHCLISK